MAQSRLDRRLFLASLGSASVLAACGGGGRSALLPSATLRSPMTGSATLTIDLTATDLPLGTNVYAYIIGATPSGAYRLDGSGTTHAIATGDNVYGNTSATFPASMQSLTATQVSAIASTYPSGGWADYSIPIPLSTTTTISLANIMTLSGIGTGTSAFSGRIYLSIGVPKLPFTVLSSSKYTQPGVGPKEQGGLVLFDWIEFSLDSLGNFNGNTTQVDQFGFPLSLVGTSGGGTPSPTQGLLNTGRPTIMSDILGLPAPFGGSAFMVPVPAGAGNAFPVTDYLRAMSPKSVVAQNCYIGPLSSYFYNEIASWYTTWQTTPLVTHDQSTGYYTGFVPTTGSFAGMLTFYYGNLPASSPPIDYANGVTPLFVITGPTNDIITSYDVFECGNSLGSGSTAAKNAQKIIAAAFNRGAMSNYLDDAACSGGFYPNGGTWNAWAKKFHDVSVNGLAYGFPYDDVCGQNPSIGLTSTQNVTITLGKLLS